MLLLLLYYDYLAFGFLIMENRVIYVNFFYLYRIEFHFIIVFIILILINHILIYLFIIKLFYKEVAQF